MPTDILMYLLILLAAAFIGGSFSKSIKQPPVVGYLMSGLILGLLFGNTFKVVTIDFLAELGIVLLLFTLGLEFPLDRFKKSGMTIVSAAIIQVLLTIIILSLLITRFSFDFYAALFMATAFSMSSTAIIVKILSDKDEMETHPSQVLITWTVTQDLIVLPLLVILPTLGKELFQSSFNFIIIFNLFKNLLVAGVVLFVVLLLGRKWVPYIINKVTALNNRELLLVAILLITITFGWFTQILGFSIEIGSFLMGIMIARSAQNHAVFSEIRPLRDIFAMLFFVTLGLLIPSGFIFTNFLQIFEITLLVIVFKFILCLILLFYLGFHARTSFFVSMGLINVGEFAFVLARMGLNKNLISQHVFGLIISVALLSILLFPPLFLSTGTIYQNLRDLIKKRWNKLYISVFSGVEYNESLNQILLKDHVVLCGYGRVGKYIGRALEMMQIPYIVIEYNHQKMQELKKNGIQVVYGDPSDRDILDYAQVDFAKAVVIAIPDLHSQSQIITNSLSLNKDIQIFCRTHKEGNQKLLKALGATYIIQPEFEASLSITDKLLKLFGISGEDINGKLIRLKIEHGLG
jgi:CPA2 family monovalent cation:H+ antiporter-2